MDGASRGSLRAALGRLEQEVSGTGTGRSARDVSEGLYAVARVLDGEPALRRALTDPAAGPASRRGLVDALFGRQLAGPALTVLRDLAASSWSAPADLRESVEVLATMASLAAAEGDGVLDDVEDELFRFERLVERDPRLRAALTDPGLPAERKVGLVNVLLKGKAQPATLRMLEIAVTRPRGRSFETVLQELTRLAAGRRQRLVAHVRVARPLDVAQSDRLARALAGIYGRDVQLQVAVDPDVLGGVEVRIGEEVLNGTVQRRLADVRRSLTR